MEIFILAILGVAFYFLSYISPSTDKIFLGFAATFFLLGAIAGFYGFSDIVVGETVTYTYNSNNLTETKTVQNIYSGSDIYTSFLPLTFFFISLYLFLIIGVTSKDERR